MIKVWHCISLCAGICFSALFLAMFIVAGTVKAEVQYSPDTYILNTDYYDDRVLLHPYQEGDCGNGNLYPSPWTWSVTTYLLSASPSGYTIYVGCAYPLNGTIYYNTLYGSPGHGPTCSTPTYPIWGNGGANDETCNFKVTYWTDW